MSARGAATALFAVAAFTIPFPLLGLDGTFVPVARYLQLSGVLLALIAREGSAGMVGVFLGLMAGHALVYAAVLVGASWGIGRYVLARISPPARTGCVIGGAVLLVAGASLLPLYDTQFHHTDAHARLWELYR